MDAVFIFKNQIISNIYRLLQYLLTSVYLQEVFHYPSKTTHFDVFEDQ